MILNKKTACPKFPVPKSLSGPFNSFYFINIYFDGARMVDVYLSIENGMGRVVIYDGNGESYIVFNPYYHSTCLSAFTQMQIRIVIATLKVAIQREYVNSNDWTNDLFGLKGYFNTSLSKYIDRLSDSLYTSPNPELRPSLEDAPSLFILTKQPDLMLKAIAR